MKRRRWVLVAIASVSILAPEAASAAVRYAEPGPGGTDPTCPRSNPCDLHEAVGNAGVGAEVVVLSGTYVLTDMLGLGSSGMVVHGDPDAPMPILETSASTGVYVALPDVTLRRLEIRHSGSGPSLDLDGRGQELVVRALSDQADAACDLPFLPGARLRDSVCSAPVGAVPAITTHENISPRTVRLRNVTAVSAGSYGLFANGNDDLTVDVKSSIFRGAAPSDVRAEAGPGGNITVIATHSNYGTASSTGAGATITAPGSGTNQLAAPIFADAAAGDFRQAAGSPTRNAGVVDAESGSLDFEGEPRSQESAPDIGADEFDVIAPSVAITSGPGEGETIETRDATIGFAADDFLATAACEVDGAGFGPCSGPGGMHQLTDLSDGPHTFSVRATDTNGLTGATATRSFTVAVPPVPEPPPEGDTVSPETKITKSPPNRTERTTAKFKFNSDEPGSTFMCKRDGKAFKACDSPQRYRRLDEAKHRFQVQAIDAAGNADPTPDKDRWKVVD